MSSIQKIKSLTRFYPHIQYEWLICTRLPSKVTVLVGSRRFPGIKWKTIGLRQCPLWYRDVIFFNNYRMEDTETLKVVEDIEAYLVDECSPELLVTQALWGVLTEEAGNRFCREYLGVRDIEQADDVLRNTDKIYLKDYGY